MKYCESVLKLEIWGNTWSFTWTFLELAWGHSTFYNNTTLLFCLGASGCGLISLPVSCRSHQISWITFLLLASNLVHFPPKFKNVFSHNAVKFLQHFWTYLITDYTVVGHKREFWQSVLHIRLCIISWPPWPGQVGLCLWAEDNK